MRDAGGEIIGKKGESRETEMTCRGEIEMKDDEV